jgi:hypothetical protein
LEFIRAVADGIFVTDAELQTYVPEATVVPRVLEESEWPFIGVKTKDRPIIVHAPSRRTVKGTPAFLRAIERMRAEGREFDLRLVENMSHAKASQVYREADLIVDQLRIGWYGVLATEAMALGKPTIAYIRDDLWQAHGTNMPVINANPDTIYDVMSSAISDKAFLADKAVASRRYFLDTHSSDVVCRRLAKIYEDTPYKEVDWVAVGRFMDRQKVKRISVQASAEAGSVTAIAKLSSYINLENVRKLILVTRKRGFMETMRIVRRILKSIMAQ